MAVDEAQNKPNPETGGEDEEQSSGASAKALLIGLCIAALLTGGGYLYLQFVRRPSIEREYRASRKTILAVKTKGLRLAGEIDRIARDKLDKVSVLPEVINKVASLQPAIAKLITTGVQLNSRWKQTNYMENRCQVTFLKKEGYEWVGLNTFLRSIERANPKIQIKSVNYGDRSPRKDGDTLDYWQPHEMTVRAFTPRGE